MPRSKEELKEVISNFQIDGEVLDVNIWGTGHIHDTYASRMKVKNGSGKYTEKRFIHQWINHFVFKEPVKVMKNIELVTRFARERIQSKGGDPLRETLTLIPCINGMSYYLTPSGDYWRTYVFIEDAHTYDKIDNLQHVFNAAKAFGNFQRLLKDLNGSELFETIPNFHNTPKRFEAFLEAVRKDSHNRVSEVQKEIDFLMQREADMHIVTDLLKSSAIPERVTHNDTKLNNVMIDDQTGEGICVIDLDTIMPGSALYDFGDCVRLGAATAAEDEPNLNIVHFDLEKFKQLSDGFLDSTYDFLTPVEIDHLAFSAKLMTLELVVRFLTDHLNGDVYFRIHRPNHNLDRARNQMKMVQEIEAYLPQMQQIVREAVTQKQPLSN